MTSYTIHINNLTLEVIIGILEEERKSRQKIILNASIDYDMDNHFLDYTLIIEIITDLLKYKKYETLENALDEICKALKVGFSEIKSIKMSIFKPEVYKNCLVGVEILKKY